MENKLKHVAPDDVWWSVFEIQDRNRLFVGNPLRNTLPTGYNVHYKISYLIIRDEPSAILPA